MCDLVQKESRKSQTQNILKGRGRAYPAVLNSPKDPRNRWGKKKGRLRCHKRPKSREETPKEGSDSGSTTARPIQYDRDRRLN